MAIIDMSSMAMWQISLVVPKDFVKEAVEEAKARGVSFSQVIRERMGLEC